MTAFVICVGSSLLSKTADVTIKSIKYQNYFTKLIFLSFACPDNFNYNQINVKIATKLLS